MKAVADKLSVNFPLKRRADGTGIAVVERRHSVICMSKAVRSAADGPQRGFIAAVGMTESYNAFGRYLAYKFIRSLGFGG